MKKFLVLAVLAFSTSAVAQTPCNQQAMDMAKFLLESKAKAIGHRADFDKESFRADRKSSDGKIKASLYGWIYKAEYKVELVLDGACSFVEAKIRETTGK